ncbi:MAG: RNA-binding domain-containing protein, partial [Candidatus Odinarchaeota archaeon]
MMKITGSDSRKQSDFIGFDEVWFNEEFKDYMLARIIMKEGLKGESTFFEFKTELNIKKDVETLEEIMIMANGQSGILFYGWDEKKKDFNDIDAEGTMKKIIQWTRSEFGDQLQIKFRTIRHEEKNGLLVLIPATKHPLSVKGKFKVREGEEKTTLDGRRLIRFIEERKNLSVGHKYLKVLVVRKEEINQDLRVESLLVYRWSQKKIRPAGNKNPCWFRPQGLTWVDIEASFFPVNTIHSLKNRIEDIWKEGKVVIIEANPASGKTSAGRVLATWWLDDFDHVYFLNIRDLEKDQGSMISNSLGLLGKTKNVCLIIDDFHLFNDKCVVQEIQDIARNVRICIFSRPKSLSHQYKNELEFQTVHFPGDYARELVFQFFLKNSDLKAEAWITGLLGTHDNNVAGLVYEIEKHLSGVPSKEFWKEYVKDTITALVRITKIPPSFWQDLII